MYWDEWVGRGQANEVLVCEIKQGQPFVSSGGIGGGILLLLGINRRGFAGSRSPRSFW